MLSPHQIGEFDQCVLETAHSINSRYRDNHPRFGVWLMSIGSHSAADDAKTAHPRSIGDAPNHCAVSGGYLRISLLAVTFT
jgi:hypothetical protein